MIHSLFLGFKKIIHIQFFNDIYTFLLYKFYIHKFTTLESKKKKKDKKWGEKRSKKINE